MSKLSLQTELVHGRPAYTLTNGKLRISALRGGGHLVDLRLLSDDAQKAISPFYVPKYPTIDPHTYDPAQHAALYGEGENARLLAARIPHAHLQWIEGGRHGYVNEHLQEACDIVSAFLHQHI